MSMQKRSANHTRAWVMYDWANSVYPLIISSAIFPIFYEKVTRDASNGVVQFLGHSFITTEF
jgi:UMF1 family MFS transporter